MSGPSSETTSTCRINLLAEKEATSILKNYWTWSPERLGIDFPEDAKTSGLAKDTRVENIARDLRSKKEKASA